MAQFPSSNKKRCSIFNLQLTPHYVKYIAISVSLFIGATLSLSAWGYAVAVPPSDHEGNLGLLVQELSLLLGKLFINVASD